MQATSESKPALNVTAALELLAKGSPTRMGDIRIAAYSESFSIKVGTAESTGATLEAAVRNAVVQELQSTKWKADQEAAHVAALRHVLGHPDGTFPCDVCEREKAAQAEVKPQ